MHVHCNTNEYPPPSPVPGLHALGAGLPLTSRPPRTTTQDTGCMRLACSSRWHSGRALAKPLAGAEMR